MLNTWCSVVTPPSGVGPVPVKCPHTLIVIWRLAIEVKGQCLGVCQGMRSREYNYTCKQLQEDSRWGIALQRWGWPRQVGVARRGLPDGQPRPAIFCSIAPQNVVWEPGDQDHWHQLGICQTFSTILAPLQTYRIGACPRAGFPRELYTLERVRSTYSGIHWGYV